MTPMRTRLRRAVAIVVVAFQAATLALVPSWRVAAETAPGSDFCRASGAAPAAPEAPAQPHATHACGDCCTSHAGPAPVVADPSATAPRPDEGPFVTGATPATLVYAAVLPPACGPPATS